MIDAKKRNFLCHSVKILRGAFQTPQGRRRKNGQNGRLLKSCIVEIGVRMKEKMFFKT